MSNVEFVVKIEEVKAEEREDALFECLLTHPVSNITWMGNGNVIQDGEKYSVSVSDHKLIHRLVIRDCLQGDRGIYSAVVGKRTCSAWLMVEGKGTAPCTNIRHLASMWSSQTTVLCPSPPSRVRPCVSGREGGSKNILGWWSAR